MTPIKKPYAPSPLTLREYDVKKSDIVKLLLKDRLHVNPKNSHSEAFAPTNIALCKYWGKRDPELNLPVTSSLSISLANLGATVSLNLANEDKIILNNQRVDPQSSFAVRLFEFLDLVRLNRLPALEINIISTVPIAAGLASSACGFAAISMALNKLYGWELTGRELSILARLGSGSACRSIWNGFVEWNSGIRSDGMDSHGSVINHHWPELCMGLVLVSPQEKSISSRKAMERTVNTSPLYTAWPAKVSQDLAMIKQAIMAHDFKLLGKTTEFNAMTMHATMLSSWPPVSYYLPETISAMEKVWSLRAEGLDLYFTQDAGPNIKLLFLKRDSSAIHQHFPQLEWVNLF